MEKIINNKKYSTETAEHIGEQSCYQSYDNPHNFKEVLYKKKTGEYFLYGKGGGLTPYAKTVEGLLMEGQKIIPLSAEEARK